MDYSTALPPSPAAEPEGGARPRRQGAASAPGKAILLGEHAVVYGQPAIALPLVDLRLHLELSRPGDPRLSPLAARAWELVGGSGEPPGARVVASALPPGGGLGSSAALCVALLRALEPGLEQQAVLRLAHELEALFHGTPSGLDTTVVALERPVWFRRGLPPQPLAAGRTMRFLLLDSGQRSSTAEVVAEVGRRREARRAQVEGLLAALGRLAEMGGRALQAGRVQELGRLMTESHRLLARLGVSSPSLDALVEQALQSGALGAKLSGAGRGGHVLVLAPPGLELEGAVETRLLESSASAGSQGDNPGFVT